MFVQLAENFVDEAGGFDSDVDFIEAMYLEVRIDQRREKARHRMEARRAEDRVKERRAEKRICQNPRCCCGEDGFRKVFVVLVPAGGQPKRFCCKRCEDAARKRNRRRQKSGIIRSHYEQREELSLGGGQQGVGREGEARTE